MTSLPILSPAKQIKSSNSSSAVSSEIVSNTCCSTESWNLILSYIKSSMASTLREVIVPPYFALVRPELVCCIQLRGPKHKDNTNLVEWVKVRPLSWPQGCRTPSMKAGWQLEVFILENRRLQRGFTAAFQYLKEPTGWTGTSYKAM